MKINFTKMHGIGNDYVYIDCFKQNLEGVDISKLAIEMSKRHFSIGSDGVILVCPSKVADAKMRMFNLDGSEGKMCGNGVRCVAKFCADNGYGSKDKISVETLSGIKTVTLRYEGKKTLATVEMGKAELQLEKIPAVCKTNPVTLNAKDKSFEFYLVSMGNPHAITFVDEMNFDVAFYGPIIEFDKTFPERTNVEFVVAEKDGSLRMFVWERGSGITLACGTGASATAVAAVKKGYAEYDKPVVVKLLGGNLIITVRKDLSVVMEGEAATAFEGVYDYEN